jgi:hypothetical protein
MREAIALCGVRRYIPIVTVAFSSEGGSRFA